ncbi:MAG: tRNA lysidine(34) synthetase TilS [Flavobacteriales bacterium]|nr:tRNA lysidine(34) synthetase TilS [Flavobacteriales bacterium]
MIDRLTTYAVKNALFTFEDKILVACSGGADSVALVHLLFKAGFDIGIAHCNFQLRGSDSEEDALFCKELAAKYDLPYHQTVLNTKEYVNEHRVSIQQAARALRYDWFNEVMKEKGYSRLATAHHKDDQVETYLHHIMRGSTWSGFDGIPVKNQEIVRPLLCFDKSALMRYLMDHSLLWREDLSNQETKYTRNQIRHDLIPTMQEIRPGFEKNVHRQIAMFTEVNALLEEFLSQLSFNLVEITPEGLLIFVDELQEMQYKRLWLAYIGREYSFEGSRVDEILKLITADNGKAVYSSTHRIVKERNVLMITPLPSEVDSNTYFIQQEDQELLYPIHLVLTHTPEKVQLNGDPLHAQMDADTLNFPLVLRRWKEGDRFKPLGMKGKSQLLSDYFVQNKFSTVQKENTWVLESASEIIWIVGHRMSELVRLSDHTTRTYCMRWVKEE